MTPEEFAQIQREIAARQAEQNELLRGIKTAVSTLMWAVILIGIALGFALK